MSTMIDRVCGCPITSADVSRELAHLRADLAKLDDKLKRGCVPGENRERLRAWRMVLASRVAELEQLSGIAG